MTVERTVIARTYPDSVTLMRVAEDVRTEYEPADASPDIGDSSIAETAGIGGFAMAGAPAIADFVGGTPEEYLRNTTEMYQITATENPITPARRWTSGGRPR